MNKVINILSHVIYCLIFSTPHTTFKGTKNSKKEQEQFWNK